MSERDSRFTDLPPSFEAQMAPNYLGNPNVVGGIIERFLVEIIGWVKGRADGTMSAADMTQHAYERAPEFARIFAGESPDYLPIVGWNTRVGGLQETIKADLGHYWQAQRASHGDDPYQVLYAWLVWAVVEALKEEDEDLVATNMGERIASLIRLLTGSTKRKGA